MEHYTPSRMLKPMASLFLALFLVVFGLNLILGLSIPVWLNGMLACIAGILILTDFYWFRIDRK